MRKQWGRPIWWWASGVIGSWVSIAVMHAMGWWKVT